MLAIRDLVAGVGRQPIARLPGLMVGAGEAALLLGPSGSGKTTLLLAIAGLTDVLSGSIRFDAEDVGRLSRRERDHHRGRHIGMVFQDLHLVTGLSALDNVLLASFATGVKPDRMRAEGLLDRLGLGSRIHARAERLSRGEAQRLAIARAVLLEPAVLLADEPTASLDDDTCAAVLDLLMEATKEANAALVIATHDRRVRDRINRIAMAERAA